MLRVLTSFAVTGLAALTLAACTSNTQSCAGGKCDIDLSGKGATVTMGGEGGSDLELVSASGNTATVKVGGQEATLTVGEPVNMTNATLTLTEVEGEDDVQLLLDTTGFKQDGSPAASTPPAGEEPAPEATSEDLN